MTATDTRRARQARKRLHAALVAIQRTCPHCGAVLTDSNAYFDRRDDRHQLCCERCNTEPDAVETMPNGSVRVTLSIPAARWALLQTEAARLGISAKRLVNRLLKTTLKESQNERNGNLTQANRTPSADRPASQTEAGRC